MNVDTQLRSLGTLGRSKVELNSTLLLYTSLVKNISRHSEHKSRAITHLHKVLVDWLLLVPAAPDGFSTEPQNLLLHRYTHPPLNFHSESLPVHATLDLKRMVLAPEAPDKGLKTSLSDIIRKFVYSDEDSFGRNSCLCAVYEIKEAFSFVRLATTSVAT